jgi:hypothetical protein
MWSAGSKEPGGRGRAVVERSVEVEGVWECEITRAVPPVVGVRGLREVGVVTVEAGATGRRRLRTEGAAGVGDAVAREEVRMGGGGEGGGECW